MYKPKIQRNCVIMRAQEKIREPSSEAETATLTKEKTKTWRWLRVTEVQFIIIMVGKVAACSAEAVVESFTP